MDALAYMRRCSCIMATASVAIMLATAIAHGVSEIAFVATLDSKPDTHISASHAYGLTQEYYSQALSKVPEQKFPGGTFKYSNTRNFPGSTKISAALISLDVGGIRGLHWHNEAEWAYVLSGTCR